MHGYTFVVRPDLARAASLDPASTALFQPPSSLAGVVTARHLIAQIETKEREYRHLAHRGIPLIVAVGAHRFSGVRLHHLDDVIAGRLTTTFQFIVGDAYIGEETLDWATPAPWAMPEALAWIDNQLPFPLTWRPNERAATPSPAGLTGRWEATHAPDQAP